MAPKVSDLSPIDPSTVENGEKQHDAPWILRKVVGTLSGRLVLSTYESMRATGTSIACLSPWGDSSIMILPCIRVRDIAMRGIVLATGGTAAIALPVLDMVSDTVVEASLDVFDTILVEVATVGAFQLGAHGINIMLMEQIGNQVPKHSKRLKTTAVKSILITLRHKQTMEDAATGFFRSSTHADANLLSNVADYLSIQKGWFSPYLFASNRRPIIPRAMRPDVVFCHGPFLPGDYRVAETLLKESASVFDLAPPPPATPPEPPKSFLDLPTFKKGSSSPSRTPSPKPDASAKPIAEYPPPRRLLITLVGIKPHHGLWATSQRPGESVFHYLLLNGVPCIVVPALLGCPLLAWDTLTLADMYKRVADGKIESEKWAGIVKILFEYVSLCVDWDRLVVPSVGDSDDSEEPKSDNSSIDAPLELKEKILREAIDLMMEGVMQSADVKEVKKNVDIDRAGIVMFRLP